MVAKRKKILISLIFLMLLCYGSMVTASAETVCSIGKKNYSSYASAIKAVKNGQTIKMKESIAINHVWNDERVSLINRNVKFTVDMNGKIGVFTVAKGNITFKNAGTGSEIYVRNKGNVTIKSGNYQNFTMCGGKATINGGEFYYLNNGDWNQKGGTMIVNKGKVTSMINYGSTTFNGGTLQTIQNYKKILIHKVNVTWECRNSGTCILDGKKNTMKLKLLNNFNSVTVKSGNVICERLTNHKNLAIKGGVLAKTGFPYEAIDGNVTISGGTLKGPVSVDKLKMIGGKITDTVESGEIYISGGKVNKIMIPKYYWTSSVNITGGKVNYVECSSERSSIKPGCVKEVVYTD